MNVCFVGHVDHGKSTVIGRLLADTGSLPEGKLEQIRKFCEKNSRPFEYAFLLDALKEEQRQGITIDTARAFFTSQKRRYQIIDAPGHFQFLKNMISGASRADVAFLVVDAEAGFQENSKRHASMVHFLGVPHLSVLINKMDLVNYSEEKFLNLKKEISEYLKKWDLKDITFLPVSGFQGENLVQSSDKMPWFQGPALLPYLDSLETEHITALEASFWIQDVYKFTEDNDQRRIFAGVLKSGNLKPGQKVSVLPEKISAEIKSIEGKDVQVGDSLGILLKEDLYLSRGHVITDQPQTFTVATGARAQIVWLKTSPLKEGQICLVKSGTQKVEARIQKIESVTNSSDLSNQERHFIEKSDLAQVVFAFRTPLILQNKTHQELSRFVIVDDYVISGGGRWLEAVDQKWTESLPWQIKTSTSNSHPALFLWSNQQAKAKDFFTSLQSQTSEHLSYISVSDPQDASLTTLSSLLNAMPTWAILDLSQHHPSEVLRLASEWPNSITVAVSESSEADSRTQNFQSRCVWTKDLEKEAAVKNCLQSFLRSSKKN